MGTGEGSRWEVRDFAVVAGAMVLMFVGALTAPPGRAPLDVAGYVLLLVSAAVAIPRRRSPVPVLLLATTLLLIYQLRGYPGFAAALPVLFAAHAAVNAGHRFVASAAVGAALVGGVVTDVALGAGMPVRDAFQRWFLLIGWLVASAAMGEVARQHRAYLQQVEERAAEAERTREETARRRADEERLRIARELHDSLTHSISIIKVQAGVAVHLARKRAEPVPEALLAIQEASGEAMRELRSTLEVLRGDDQGGSGLDRLDDLVAGARRAGLPVTVVVTGQPRELPGPVDRAAYRITQEALTNVTRHAGQVTTSVRLEYRDDGFAVQVDDDGADPRPGVDPPPGGGDTGVSLGMGLLGMRERVGALAGTLRAGPRPGGGFTVRAELPTHLPTPASPSTSVPVAAAEPA